MLVASREINKINRKLKWEYTSYEISKEEVKNIKWSNQNKWIMKGIRIMIDGRKQSWRICEELKRIG